MAADGKKIVIVSGAPGAGKTTLAVPLALRLGFPLFSKDFIKETLTDVFGDAGGDLATSRKIGGASMELIWALARYAPQAVLEANFRPRSEYERTKLAGLNASIIEVHCDCGEIETARRFRDRAAASGHHAAHPMKEMSAEMLAEYDQPVGLGRVIAVDTQASADVESIAQEIIRSFSYQPLSRSTIPMGAVRDSLSAATAPTDHEDHAAIAASRVMKGATTLTA